MLDCALRDGSTELYICIKLAATCTLRRSEIAGLGMGDIDFDHNIIHIHKAIALTEDNKWVGKAPKTYGSDRYILTSPNLIRLIKNRGM